MSTSSGKWRGGANRGPCGDEAGLCPRCAVRDWADARAEKIPLSELLDTWVPRMEREHMKFAVFPLRDGPCAQVDAADVAEDLRAQRTKMED